MSSIVATMVAVLVAISGLLVIVKSSSSPAAAAAAGTQRAREDEQSNHPDISGQQHHSGASLRTHSEPTDVVGNHEMIFDGGDDELEVERSESNRSSTSKGPERKRRQRSVDDGDELEVPTFNYNDHRQLKRLLHHFGGQSKLGRQHVDQESRWQETGGDDDITEDESSIGGVAVKRQPLDRLDMPIEWRRKIQPKFVQNRKADKRQPLDRIDEPSEWRARLIPKLNRHGKMLTEGEEDQEEEEEIMGEEGIGREARTAEKRQPLDRLDEPSSWKVKLVPKYNHLYTLKRRTKNN